MHFKSIWPKVDCWFYIFQATIFPITIMKRAWVIYKHIVLIQRVCSWIPCSMLLDGGWIQDVACYLEYFIVNFRHKISWSWYICLKWNLANMISEMSTPPEQRIPGSTSSCSVIVVATAIRAALLVCQQTISQLIEWIDDQGSSSLPQMALHQSSRAHLKNGQKRVAVLVLWLK